MSQNVDDLRRTLRIGIGALIGINAGVLTVGANFHDEGIKGKVADAEAVALYEQRIDTLAQQEQTAKMMAADAVALVRYKELGFLDKDKVPQVDKLKLSSEQARKDFSVNSQKLSYDIFSDPVLSEASARNIIERLAKMTETPLHAAVANTADERQFDSRFLRECAVAGVASTETIPSHLKQISECTSGAAFPRIFLGAAGGGIGGGLLTFAFLAGLRRYHDREKPKVSEHKIRVITKKEPE